MEEILRPERDGTQMAKRCEIDGAHTHGARHTKRERGAQAAEWKRGGAI